jgi:hypothetical protein
MRRFVRSFASVLGVVALVPMAAGCSQEETSTSAAVPVDDGGYALVRVEVPGGHEARVSFAVNDAAANESFYLLVSEDDAPKHIGWFDVTPWSSSAGACTLDDDRDGCNPEGAGRFASVRTAGSGPVSLEHRVEHCSRDHEDTCTFYYAVLAGSRLATPRSGLVTVTTRDVIHAERAEIALIQ